jgi:predicted aspartyl protease
MTGSPDRLEDREPRLRQAERLFGRGLFGAAETAYRALAAQHPGHPVAAGRLGQLALYANRLPEARSWLGQAQRLAPRHPALAALLAEVCYREDDFAAAAAHLRAIGRVELAEKLAAFAGLTPYALHAAGPSASLPWLVREPLPLVRAGVNGMEANLLIDTGAGETVLDAAFAAQAQVLRQGSEPGMFAGGRTAAVAHGQVEQLDLDAFALRHVPVQLYDTQRLFAPFFPDTPVHGIIGTVLLYHFTATLDYPGGVLRLLRRGVVDPGSAAASEGPSSVPFWLAGDHYVVAWGNINREHPVLMFIDTGMTGAAFAAPLSTAMEAALPVSVGDGATGYGGGGTVRAAPLVLSELWLGAAGQSGLSGLLLDAFPLERQFGFRIGGLLAHDFFRPYRLTLDFTRMELSLYAGSVK